MDDVCVVPPRVLLDSANQAVSLSERVLLDCPVSDADPAPVILWTKNDQPLTLGGRLQQLPNGSLAIYDSAVCTTHHQTTLIQCHISLHVRVCIAHISQKPHG